MNKIWYCTLETLPRFLLLAIADHADDNGASCYPSVERLQIKTGLSRRSVQKYLAGFRESGVLRVIAPATRYMPTRYRIDITKLTFQERTRRTPASVGPRSAPEVVEGCTPDQQGCTPDTAGAHKLCTQTIIEPSEKSSSTLEAAKNLPQLGGDDPPFEDDEPIEEDNKSCCDPASCECTSEPCEAEADEPCDFEAEITDEISMPSKGETRSEQGGEDEARSCALKVEILRQYRESNDGRECPWTGAEGYQLRATLDRLHSWSIEDLIECVRNRFASTVNLSESPKKWLPRLEDYANGALDRYGRINVFEAFKKRMMKNG